MNMNNMQEIIDNIGDTVDIVKIIKPIYNFKANEQKGLIFMAEGSCPSCVNSVWCDTWSEWKCKKLNKRILGKIQNNQQVLIFF